MATVPVSTKRRCRMARQTRMSIQHKTSTVARSRQMATTQNEERQPLSTTPSFLSGEGGIRTPGPPFGRHSISSAAQSTTLSPLHPLLAHRDGVHQAGLAHYSSFFSSFFLGAFSLGAADLSLGAFSFLAALTS